VTLIVWQANSVPDVREQARWLGQQVNIRLGAYLQARWPDQQVNANVAPDSLAGPAKRTCFAANTD
jgi:hypothetical protein